MKLQFNDRSFSYPLLRVASYRLYGGSEIGELLATAHQIREGDFESWYIEWQRTAARIEAVAADSLQKGQRVSAGQAFLQASNYYRTAEFFLAPTIRAVWSRSRKAAQPFGNFLN